MALGEPELGACRASDLANAVEEGGVRRDELSIVRSVPAVPEILIACRAADVDYYKGVLERTAGRMAAPEPSARCRSAVELLEERGVRSLQPVSAGQMERAAALYDRMGQGFQSGQR